MSKLTSKKVALIILDVIVILMRFKAITLNKSKFPPSRKLCAEDRGIVLKREVTL